MAIRAMALLFPLLGTTNILFCIEPSSSIMYKLVYRVANAVLQSSQVLNMYLVLHYLQALAVSLLKLTV